MFGRYLTNFTSVILDECFAVMKHLFFLRFKISSKLILCESVKVRFPERDIRTLFVYLVLSLLFQRQK